MSKFNPFPSVRRDRQRQLDASPNATPPISAPRSPVAPVRPPLHERTSTEQTVRSSMMSSPISPPRNALALNANGNEGTTVRSAGLSSTDDEAFELYLQAQKQLQSHRAAQSRAQLRGQGETGETVADMEAREFEAISEASDGDSVEEQDEEGELGHMQEIVEGLWIGDVVAARDGTALQEAGIVRLPFSSLNKPN